MATVELKYRAREQFIPFHTRTERWSCLVAHRRAGKTLACLYDLVDAALRCKEENPRYAYITPFYAQAKDVAWTYIKEAVGPLMQYGAEVNESELRVDLPNGARLRLYGADNYDRLRGIYLDGVVLDEFADMDPRAWSEVIRPALSDRKGWATFIGTPKGENTFFEIWQDAQDDPDWFSLMLKASDTGLIDKEELNAAKRAMTHEQYRQEYECSFQAAIVGAYYGKLMEDAEAAGRIGPIPVEGAVKVHTVWDLGIGDSTAIWFYQAVGKEVRVIDYYEASGVGLDHYFKVLEDKDYLYGNHYLPHDVEVRELGTGRSRKETLNDLGIKVKVVKKLSIEDGINAARKILPRCWFDKDKCSTGIKALRQYRTEFDEKRKVFRLRPLHDWSSHAADAFRYLAVSLEDSKSGYAEPIDYSYYDKGVI